MPGTSSGNSPHQPWQARTVDAKRIAPGVRLLNRIGFFNCYTYKTFQIYVAVLTFLCYTSYHMSRKPFSVVANVLAPDCSQYSFSENSTLEEYPGWAPFNVENCKTVLGYVNYAWLFTYAIFMFASGYIADRVHLRYFLSIGMFGSGIFAGLLGVAYYANIHHIAFFIVVQIFVGIFQSTGWPGVVAVMGNWFGIKYRGLFLGVWNSNTSVGNILGTAIPSIWAKQGHPWAWSFFVPAIVMFVGSVLLFFFLPVDPAYVGLPPPKHHTSSSERTPHVRSLSEGEVCTTKYDNTQDPAYEKSRRQSSSDVTALVDAQANGDLTNGAEPDITQDIAHEQTRSSDVTSDDAGNHSKTSHSRSVTFHLLDKDVKPEPALVETKKEKVAVSLLRAVMMPGVIEFSLALFFAKLVGYTFLFWLPYYIRFNEISGDFLGDQEAGLLAVFFDVGGIIGGIATGLLSDLIHARAISSVIMLYLAVPTLFFYRFFGHYSVGVSIALIILCGLFINGPDSLITTAVSNDLGTHNSLKENQKVKATVGAIIDGFGSLGAGFGPLITGIVSDNYGWDNVFYILMASCFFSSLMLSRLLFNEFRRFYHYIKRRRS